MPRHILRKPEHIGLGEVGERLPAEIAEIAPRPRVGATVMGACMHPLVGAHRRHCRHRACRRRNVRPGLR